VTWSVGAVRNHERSWLSALPLSTVDGAIRNEMIPVWSVSLALNVLQESGALPSK
jgi:hypothetical protein